MSTIAKVLTFKTVTLLVMSEQKPFQHFVVHVIMNIGTAEKEHSLPSCGDGAATCCCLIGVVSVPSSGKRNRHA